MVCHAQVTGNAPMGGIHQRLARLAQSRRILHGDTAYETMPDDDHGQRARRIAS